MISRQGITTAIMAILAVTLAFWASPAMANSKYAAVVINADTGEILFDKYSTKKRYPASLTKMMTLYLLFEEIEAGRLTLQTPMKVSAFAAGQPPSKLGLKAGSTITVETAIQALIIDSSNDVAVVVAEKISGTQRKFAAKMTRKARAMGMRNTRFRNASGLPDRRQITTARDLAILAKRVSQDFPQFYPYFSQKSFTYNGRVHKTHNRVVAKLAGASGLKTGYTRASGYNLATVAERKGNHLIGIVLGGRSTRTRDAHMISIMNETFAKIDRNPQMLAAFHRKKIVPALKPTTLASLGGVWPPQQAENSTLLAAKDPKGISDSIGDDPALRQEIIEASFNLANADGLTTEDDIGVLLSAMSDAERLNYLNLKRAESESIIAQGDVDMLAPELVWSIQIGAYKSSTLAKSTLKEALSIAEPWIGNGQENITTVKRNGKTLYRTRISYLTDSQAESACSALLQAGRECFVIRDSEPLGG